MRLLAILALLAPALALADVPATLGYQGRLLKSSGEPETGVVDLTFSVYAADTAGEPLWSETQHLALSDGFYATFLGAATALPPDLFDGSDRFLEVAMGGTAFTPRQRIASVAYALRATNATNALNVVGGKVDASSLSVNGKPVVDASGQLVGAAGAAFAPLVHTHDAADIVSGVLDLKRIPQGAGSLLDADTVDGQHAAAFARADALAASGTINTDGNPVDWTQLKSVPADFADGKDDGLRTVAHDVTLLGDGAGNPLGIDPAVVQLRVASACNTGEYMGGINADGSVVCFPDQDSGGTVTAVNGTFPVVATTGRTPTLSLTDTCTASQILKWNGTAWACAADNDTAPTAGSGIAISGRTVGLGACPSGQVWKSNGSAWACAADNDTTYAAGTGLALAAGSFSLRKDCIAGQIVKWDGTNWACAADQNSGGTVTAVNTSAPLVSSGGGTPIISLPKATGSADGYLAAADYQSFSSKIASLTAGNGITLSGTATAPVISVSNGAFVQNQSSPQQTASLNISGTAYVGGSVGIGNQAPAAKLDVTGGIRLTGGNTTCAAANQGEMRFIAGAAGSDDQLAACMKSAAGTFQWVLVARGGP